MYVIVKNGIRSDTGMGNPHSIPDGVYEGPDVLSGLLGDGPFTDFSSTPPDFLNEFDSPAEAFAAWMESKTSE